MATAELLAARGGAWPHRVRELRLAALMTQKAVAERLGVEPVQVRRWEYGYRLPEQYHEPLARLFGVSLVFLLCEEGA